MGWDCASAFKSVLTMAVESVTALAGVETLCVGTAAIASSLATALLLTDVLGTAGSGTEAAVTVALGLLLLIAG